MSQVKKNWSDYTDDEKMIAINAYLDGIADFDEPNKDNNPKQIDWLRAHIPAYKPKNDEPYIFISYSHKDSKQVYSDLAGFLYNSKRRVRFWYDEGLPIGEDWEKFAGKFIEDKNCVGVLFYLSKNLLLSPSVYKEMALVRRLSKRYCTVALNPQQPTAEDVFASLSVDELNCISGNQNVLKEFFPKQNTSMLHYGEKWDIEYRIDKISDVFNVTEDVIADFEYEETEDGLCITKYCGESVNVRIPEAIGGKTVVEVKANFPQACKLFIPKSVIRINVDYPIMFGTSENLEEIIVDKNNRVYCDLNGVLCNKNATKILRAPINWDWTRQFELINNIKETDFLNSVYNLFDNIEKNGILENNFYKSQYFFSDLAFFVEAICKSRVKVDVNSFIKFVNILPDNSWAQFELFNYLKRISIFKNVNEISDCSFFNCKNLAYIFMPDSVKKIGGDAFFGCNLSLVFLSNNIELIPDMCFCNCKQLRCILSGDKFNDSFTDFDLLWLTNNIKEIGYSAFSGTAIKKSVLPVSLTQDMLINTFESCFELEEIRITGAIKCVSAFANCSVLNEVEIEDGVEALGYECFRDCRFLMKIDIPVSVKKIEIGAFNGCNRIKEIHYAGTIYDWGNIWGDGEFPIQIRKATTYCSDGVIEPSQEQ